MKPSAPLCHAVPPSLDGAPLQQALATLFEIAPGRARELIEQGAVFIGRRREQRPAQRVRAGQELRADPHFQPPRVAPLAGRVLHVDDALLIVDKPAGMPTGPTLAGAAGTLVYEAQRQRLAPFRPCEVHRLDAATSGALAMVREGAPLRDLMDQFKDGQVRKRYLCRVHLRGPAPTDEIVVTSALAPDPRRPQRWRAVEPGRQGARSAETRARVLRAAAGYADLEVFPLTGRTHQIRVHLSSIGLPLWGDRAYGDAAADRAQGASRLWLHAADLALRHPASGAPVAVAAPVPADMAGFALGPGE